MSVKPAIYLKNRRRDDENLFTVFQSQKARLHYHVNRAYIVVSGFVFPLKRVIFRSQRYFFIRKEKEAKSTCRLQALFAVNGCLPYFIIYRSKQSAIRTEHFFAGVFCRGLQTAAFFRKR